MAVIHFSPANQLLDEAKELCKEIHPFTFSFPRWYRNGSSLWLESSSGSRLLTVHFASNTVIVPSWKVDLDGGPSSMTMPLGWQALYEGSLFNPDGSAVDHDAFEAASAAWVRGRRS